MKKILALVVSLSCIGAAISTPANAGVRAGTTCLKLGSKSITSDKKFTCIKSGKKFVWDTGVLVSKVATKPASSASTPSTVIDSSEGSPQSTAENTNFDPNQKYYAMGQLCDSPGQQGSLSDINYICGHDFTKENVWEVPCAQVGENGWQVNGVNGTCTAAGPTMQFWVFPNIASIVASFPKQAPKPGDASKIEQVPNSKPTQDGALKPGSGCTGTDSIGIKISDGVLYCVLVSDGSRKFIERFNVAPVISNPQSREPLEACQAPDLRGNIPPGMSNLATAHNSVVPTKLLKHSGLVNILVIPIDFSDAIGTNSPESEYKSDFDKMAKWFSAYSNGKLQMNVDLQNKWFRAPLVASKYDPSLWPSNDSDTQQKLVQNYINMTLSQLDYSKADGVVFVYPKSAFNSTGYLHLWSADFNIGTKTQSLSVLSSLGSAGKYEPFWQWLSHELLHSMGLAMHSPADPAGWGIEWGRFSYSEALLPWNQMILDWINPDQYYCVSTANVTKTKLTLIPQESSNAGLRTAFIRVSNSEVLMVVSYRNDTWAYNTPDSFYGTMVALIDTTKQVDMSGENSDDTFDGVKYQKPGVWLHPQNQVKDDNIVNILHTGESGALMYLGDSVTYKGITIKLVDSNNFDTVEISKA